MAWMRFFQFLDQVTSEAIRCRLVFATTLNDMHHARVPLQVIEPRQAHDVAGITDLCVTAVKCRKSCLKSSNLLNLRRRLAEPITW